jgi:hypothetical protein
MLFRNYQRQWGELASVFCAIWNYLEDVRVEYQFVLDFPHAFPYIAAFRGVMRDMIVRWKTWKTSLPSDPAEHDARNQLQKALDVTRDFVQFGTYPPDWRSEVNFLAGRLTLVARSTSAKDTLRLASEYLAYVILRRNIPIPKTNVQVEQKLNRKRANDIERIASQESHAQGSRRASTTRSKNTHIQPTTPWGGAQGQWDRLVKGFAHQLMHGGGVGVSDSMKILDVIETSGFVARVESMRKDEIRRYTEAFKRIESRTTHYAHDGIIALERQQDAYTQSFLGPDDQGKVYARKRRVPAQYDAAVVIDVSGSMGALAEQAMSDAVVLVKAMDSPHVRLGIFGVNNDLHVYKHFDERLEAARLSIRSEGLTNFHHFFTKFPTIATWTHPRRMIFIISDGKWSWGRIVPDTIKNNPFYQDVEWYVVFMNEWRILEYGALDKTKAMFKQVFFTLPDAVSAATGMRVAQ